MVRIAPIKLQYNPKTLWFDANGLDISQGDEVVVITARGIEFGSAVKDVFEVEDAEVKKLKSELKPVKRLATPEDVEKAEEMRKRSEEALPVFKEMAAETSDDMHPVSVEFLLDGDKAIFYFEAEERVDFRELVRKLAAKFHVRIDMRQIGVRDEARIVGGLGHCGQELCCRRLGGEFNPVSIRMAKEQDLSLNPQKISGVCGRLMCCLRYEFDAYKEFKDRAPKINAKIETPEGIAKVVDLNVPREIVTIQLEDNKRVKIPLDEMEPAEKGTRPSKVSKQAFERFANQDIFDTFDAIAMPHFGDTSLFSKNSAPAKKRVNQDTSKKNEKSESSGSARKPRRRTKMSKGGESQTEQVKTETNATQSEKPKKRGDRKPRRRSQNAAKGQTQQTNNQQPTNQQSAKRDEQGKKKENRPKQQSGKGPRPGQRSSGLRSGSESAGQTQQNRSTAKSQNASAESAGRKTRRRSHKAGSNGES